MYFHAFNLTFTSYFFGISADYCKKKCGGETNSVKCGGDKFAENKLICMCKNEYDVFDSRKKTCKSKYALYIFLTYLQAFLYF